MTTHLAMQAATPGAPLSPVQVEDGEPGAGQVRVTVEASGICHSDDLVLNGHIPGATFPLTSGHEIAGRIDVVGAGVAGWNVGDRVAIGWYGGSCGHCDACRDGDGIYCAQAQIPGVAYPGGFAESVVVPAVALAAIPDVLTATEAAPLACAGVTVFNALRRSAARPGDLVAILGLGGLGHLGVQFAAKMGYRVAAVARGTEKAPLAMELGAHHYIDSTTQNVAAELLQLGGAKVVVATVTSAEAMSATIDGLSRRGELIVVGIDTASLTVNALQLTGGGRKIYGHASGNAVDTEATLQFAAQTGVRPWVETRSLTEADEALHHMLDGTARFRVVLETGR